MTWSVSFSAAIEARQVKGTVAVAPTVGEIEVDPNGCARCSPT